MLVSLGILHMASCFTNCVQFLWAHSSQSFPNTAVILINAKQSTSAPWELFGGEPKKCLCRFINENEVGMLQSENFNFFLHFDTSACLISFSFFGLCLGYNKDMLLVGVDSFFCCETVDTERALMEWSASWWIKIPCKVFGLQGNCLALSLPIFVFGCAHVSSLSVNSFTEEEWISAYKKQILVVS